MSNLVNSSVRRLYLCDHVPCAHRLTVFPDGYSLPPSHAPQILPDDGAAADAVGGIAFADEQDGTHSSKPYDEAHTGYRL